MGRAYGLEIVAATAGAAGGLHRAQNDRHARRVTGQLHGGIGFGFQRRPQRLGDDDPAQAVQFHQEFFRPGAGRFFQQEAGPLLVQRDAHAAARFQAQIIKVDKKRASYHNFYSTKKWGNADSYHLSVDSGAIGIDGTVDLIRLFADKKEA